MVAITYKVSYNNFACCKPFKMCYTINSYIQLFKYISNYEPTTYATSH